MLTSLNGQTATSSSAPPFRCQSPEKGAKRRSANMDKSRRKRRNRLPTALVLMAGPSQEKILEQPRRIRKPPTEQNRHPNHPTEKQPDNAPQKRENRREGKRRA